MNKNYLYHKLNSKCNQTLDPKGGDIIQSKMILPIVGFETTVSMNTSFWQAYNRIGGIFMDIRKKFWIGAILYTVLSWCIALHLIRIAYS